MSATLTPRGQSAAQGSGMRSRTWTRRWPSRCGRPRSPRPGTCWVTWWRSATTSPAASAGRHHRARLRVTVTSAGILLYRRTADGIEVLLGHMGGPFWARKDDGAWSIPKGEYDDEPA